VKVFLRCAAICLPGIALGIWLACISTPARSVDYNQFFSASHLLGTGQVYNWSALKALELQHTAAVPTARIPSVLLGHKLLSWLPYSIARALWFGASLAALLLALKTWPRLPFRRSVMALAWSFPAIAALIYGQDVPFWLLFFSLGLFFLDRRHDAASGFCFSLCICKYHLALGLPILLIAQRRWTALIAATAGVAFWIALSFVIEGPIWPVHYLQMARLPEFSPHLERMPCLAGLLSATPSLSSLEPVALLVIALLLWRACRRAQDIGLAGGLVAAAGVLAAHHSYLGDCTLMLPLWIRSLVENRRWLRNWAFALLTPVPFLLLCSPASRAAQIIIIGLVISELATRSQKRPRANTFSKVPNFSSPYPAIAYAESKRQPEHPA
jgi:Glycosyltransferase family 87